MAYNADAMAFEVPDTDTVYVSGLPLDATEESIAQHFGSIGVVKQDKKKGGPKIWLYKDKASGAFKVPPQRPAAGLSGEPPALCLSRRPV